jgi:hypothetical protein
MYARYYREGEGKWAANGDVVGNGNGVGNGKSTSISQSKSQSISQSRSMSQSSSRSQSRSRSRSMTSTTNNRVHEEEKEKGGGGEWKEKEKEKGKAYENFAQPDFNKFLYSFTMMAFFDTKTRKDLFATRSIQLRSTDAGADISDTELNFTAYEDRGHSMRIIITDLTAYQHGQPLLSLTVVANKGEQTFPMVFVDASPKNLLGRQIEVPIHNVEHLAVSFNLEKMKSR